MPNILFSCVRILLFAFLPGSVVSFVRAEATNILTITADRSAYANSGSNTVANGELDVGFRALANGVHEYRAAVGFSFDFPSWLGEKVVQYASFKLYYFDAWGSFSNRTISVHRIEENWQESNLPFTIRHESALSQTMVGGNNPRWITWDATSAARFWATNAAANHGLLLLPVANGSMDNTHRFRSRNYADSSFHPTLEIAYTDPPPPVITTHPTNRIVEVGDAVTFSVEVASAFPVAFRWYRNDEPISNGDGSTLLIPSARKDDSGTYRVSVTSIGGIAWSRDWTLKVVGKPPVEAWRISLATNDRLTMDSPLLAQDPFGSIIAVSAIKTNVTPLFQSSQIMLIAKVSRTGAKLWETRYEEPYHRELEPQALNIDSLGNIYIAGLANRKSLIVMKLSPNGERLWASRRETGFGATEIIIDSGGFIVTSTAGKASSSAWDPRTQSDIFSWDAGGWALLDRQGNFLSAHPNGNGQPVPAIVQVVNTTTLSMLGWGGSDFGVKNIAMLTGDYLESKTWTNSSPPPNQVLVRESPIGVHVLQITNGAIYLQLFSRAGAPLWQKLPLPLAHPLLDPIPALAVDSEGNSFAGVFFHSGITNDLGLWRVRSNGEIAWSARYNENLGDDIRAGMEEQLAISEEILSYSFILSQHVRNCVKPNSTLERRGEGQTRSSASPSPSGIQLLGCVHRKIRAFGRQIEAGGVPHKSFPTKIVTLGDEIRVARFKAGVSQKQLAKRLRVLERTFRAWEKDLIVPTQQQLAKIQDLLLQETQSVKPQQLTLMLGFTLGFSSL